MDNALISILGINVGQFEQETPVELITGGRFYKEDGRYVVEYNESELTGMDGTTTTFNIEPERVEMRRTGDVVAQMVFEKDRKHVSFTETPVGALTVGVCARKIAGDFDDSGGTLSLVYDIEVDHQKTGTNSIFVRVKGDVLC
ncbi:MAG: DUF1934 domain-containing protein [Oscillospiraceae bacterium]|nr:DUF1934 domain-containing protein [Oscillospiraceae bacterium]